MIDVINLRKSFGQLEILKGINITINKGDIVAVLGPSGSGKSTFLRCLNCMEDPTSGSIIFNGVDIADMKVDINLHRRHMGMVFQHFNLFANKTVIQNIMLAPVYVKCQDLKKAKRKNLVRKIKNVFSSKKEELEPITATKASIKQEAKDLVDRDLRGHFRPEFLNRLDEIIMFKPLTKDNIGGIVELLLDDLNRRLKDQELSLALTKAAKDYIIEGGYDPVYGARPLKRHVQKYVESLTATLILSGDIRANDRIVIDVENGELTAHTEAVEEVL